MCGYNKENLPFEKWYNAASTICRHMSAVLLQIGKTESHFSNFTFKLLNVFSLLAAFLLVPLPFKYFYLASVKEIIVKISLLMQT